MEKDVYKSKDGKEWVEQKECHPRQLALTSKYIAPYWYDAIKAVSQYEKERGLQEVHKLVDDHRIEAGINLYRNGHITESVVTKHKGGDVRAVVLSEDRTKEYVVLIKDYLPEKLPQFNYEREKYIANLFVDCTCSDHHMSHYKDNSSMMCKHIVCTLLLLIDKFNMPKIFVSQEEKLVGYQKSDVEELEIEIKAMPLVKFTPHINLLLLKSYRGMHPVLGISIHRVSNTDFQEIGTPQWMTYLETKSIERLLKGISTAYKEISRAYSLTDEEINKKLLEAIGVKKKKWWKFGRT